MEMATSWKCRKSFGGWRRRVVVGCLWFALCESIVVLGFGKWSPFHIRTVPFRTSSLMRDASENFPTGLMDLQTTAGNASRALLQSAPTSSAPNFVSPEKLQELQDSVNIVSVIGAYGLPRFQRSGEYRATCLCPFHDDHNPSMSIDGARGIYKCFSCGAGGNVFTFVREYAKLQGEKELSFFQAVKLVDNMFASGKEDFALNLPPGTKERLLESFSGTAVPKTNFSSLSNNKGAKGFATKNKKRIILANAAAAAFYENCLVTRPSAGLARAHLRERGMSPRTVRAFGIGYAPDAFFSKTGEAQSWGDGSLVQHLQQKGFTTTEIVDAGLATIVKRQQEETSETADVPFSALIDRFRGRLIVPIFDDSGLQVLGFGGRILGSPESDTSPGNYTQPKYLNSPESPVFQKKNILFGQHMARKALRFWDKEDGIPRAVVIVEGYMDAIALWQEGVREAVACMGTGLTAEQLTSAAILAGSKNGRVILCLDNDQAGIAATERVCRSGILSIVGDSYPVEFRVARLPENVKDPADYMELNNDESTKLDDRFRKDVLDENSLEWTDWYQKHILGQYNEMASTGESGSFADLMDHLGGFLAMVNGDEEDGKRFRDIVDFLAATVATQSNETEVSETVRLQIEAELKRKTSMKRKPDEGASFLALPIAGNPRGDITRTLARMAPRSDDDRDPEFQLPKKKRRQNKITPPQDTSHPFDSQFTDETQSATPSKTSRRFRAKNLTPKKPALTPHFSGFEFSNNNDKTWLDGFESTTGENRGSKSGEGNRNGSNDIVYFNSNEYHGGNFITEEALSAGYTNGFVPRDPELLTKGINSMIDLKEDAVLESAENDLLRCLLEFPSARASLQRIIDVNRSSGSEDHITWTSSEKLWLFRRLTSNDPDLRVFGKGNLIEFQSYLSSKKDALPGAISKPTESLTSGLTERNHDIEISPFPPMIRGGNMDDSLQEDGELVEQQSVSETEEQQTTTPTAAISGAALEQRGTLDHFFNDNYSEERNFILPEGKVALRAQEAYYTMLWSSSVQKLSRKKQDLAEAAKALFSSNQTNESNHPRAQTGGSELNTSLLEFTIGEDTYMSLRADIQDATEQVQLLAGALQGLSSRLIQKAMPADGWHPQKIYEDYNELSARLSEHMKELDKWSIPDSEEISDDEAYETMLEQSQLEWGDLYEDDRMWSSDDIVQTRLPPSMTPNLIQASGGYDESLDSFSERMEQEWGWLDEPNVDFSFQSEESGPYEFDEQRWTDNLLLDK